MSLFPSSTGLGICYKPAAVLPFLQAALTRRVDVALMSDSNTVKGTEQGHNVGMRNAFASRFGMYATGLISVGNGGNEGQGSGFVGASNWPSPATAQAPTGITAIDAYLANDGVSEANFMGQSWQYMPVGGNVTGQQVVTIQAVGMQGVQLPLPASLSNNQKIIYACPMDLTQELSWEWTQGIFTTGGYWNPTAYQTAAQNTSYATAHVSSGGGAYGMQDGNLIVPAGARNSNGTYGTITFSPCNFHGGNTLAFGIKGPILIAYQRVQAPGALTGIAYTTNLYQGGQDSRNAALAWQNTGMTAKVEYLRQLTRLQNGAAPMACFQIMHGGNDLNDLNLSVGPNPAVSQTPAGFADNLTAIIEAIRGAWTMAGYPLANLYFIIGPYHPAISRLNTMLTWQGTSYQELVAYENAATSVADAFANVTVMRGSQLLPSGFQESALYMQSKGFYDYQGDAHLIRQGYEWIGFRAVDALISEAWGSGSTSSPSGAFATSGTATLSAGTFTTG